MKANTLIAAFVLCVALSSAQHKKGSGNKNPNPVNDAVVTSEKELNEHIIKQFSATDKVEFYELKDALTHPDEVTHLKLQRSGLTEVPAEISKFKNLIELDLSDNDITSVSGKLTGLANLQVLNLSGNELKEIPDVSQLKSLLVLNLSGNQIAGGTVSSEHLERLYLNNNKLTAIPGGIAGLKHLKSLYLHFNGITVLDENLLGIKSLEILMVQYNKIKDEPDAFANTGLLKYVFFPQAIDNRFVYGYVRPVNAVPAPSPGKLKKRDRKGQKEPSLAYSGNNERAFDPYTMPQQNAGALSPETPEPSRQGYVSGSVNGESKPRKGFFGKLFAKKQDPGNSVPTFIVP